MSDVQHVNLSTGACGLCGGTHYGSGMLCPYRCAKCGHSTNPCEKPDCERNQRWTAEHVPWQPRQRPAAGVGLPPVTPDQPASPAPTVSVELLTEQAQQAETIRQLREEVENLKGVNAQQHDAWQAHVTKLDAQSPAAVRAALEGLKAEVLKEPTWGKASAEAAYVRAVSLINQRLAALPKE